MTAARGYTVVELMMSLAILTIGVTGVIAMQKVTVTSNQHAKNLAIATQVAQAWMDQLRTDAVEWNHPSASLGTDDRDNDTVWLHDATVDANAWVRPAWDAAHQFGPGFDAQGRPLDTTNGFDGVRFCTHIRLTWLYRPQGSMTGNGLIRSEVRVFWLREGQSPPGTQSFCAETQPNTLGSETSRYHFVYNVSAVRQNTAF